MSARITRASRAKEAATLNSAIEESKDQLPSSKLGSGSKQAKKPPAKSKRVKSSALPENIKTETLTQAVTPNSSRKRARSTPRKIKNDPDELPHNLGNVYRAQSPSASNNSSTTTKRAKSSVNAVQASRNDTESTTTGPKMTPKKNKKNNSYGHTFGVTPYPDWAHPTTEECYEVNRLLGELHGVVVAPKEIPKAKLNVTGCGEVPHVLDALIRTRLSANTSRGNSKAAFEGLVKAFGITDGPSGQTVNWDVVRQADVSDIFEAIKKGGLAKVKSKDIKTILDLVYEENQARREALLSDDRMAPGEGEESEAQKQEEIKSSEENLLTLDYLHLLETEEAFAELIKYPGIGAKTAACVLLFNMQRPCFAVDTHVFRLCKWLGWVPPNATRDTTFSHCEVRIPDELKYPLHWLLIDHGRSCPRCRAITGEASAGWDEGCVIEALVKRTGARKDGSSKKKKSTPVKGAKKRKAAEIEDEEDDSELSDWKSEDGE